MTATRQPAYPPDTENVRDGTMGLLEHLDELRSRLIKALLAIGAGMVAALFFVDRIADILLAPAREALGIDSSIVTSKPGEGFAYTFDVALISGLVLASPFVMYQVWRFVAPGLYARERRLVIPFVLMAATGTVAGALFSHFIVFPSTMAFFDAFNRPWMKAMPRLQDTFSLYKTLLVAMVAVFQLPTLVFFLARLRLVTAGFLWRNIRYAILIIFVAAAVLTASPDPWNQTVVAAPMLGMYLLSIAIAWLVRPRDDSETAVEAVGLVISAAAFEQARRKKWTR
jgi:sec-independent protein translocase protein TatC